MAATTRSWSILKTAGRALSDPASLFQTVDVSEIGKSRLIIFGEIHSVPSIIKVQAEIQRTMVQQLRMSSSAKLHVVMEHFSQDMQNILDEYCKGDINLQELDRAYKEVGTEGHDVTAYKEVLEFARENPSRCVLHGGFIPRTYARTLMREGVDVALEAAKTGDYVAADEDCWSTDDHYRYFESLLTGRDPQDLTRPLSDQFRKMLPAQVLKDASMAHRVNELIADADSSASEDRVLVLCGNGHMGFGHGVPERIFKRHPALQSQTASVYSRPALLESDEQSNAGLLLPDDVSEVLTGVVPSAPESGAAADFCLVFQDKAAMDKVKAEAEAARVKRETRASYNGVGSTAHLEGDIKKAERIMTLLGYKQEEIEFVGSDAYNYQGVGHLHRHANIQEGEVVLDLGSGLGVDSLIASSRVGKTGRVVGVDISEEEVRHASKRAEERGANARFAQADVEDLSPIPNECIDVIISNGAFCLVPDKKQAFREAFRVLKPGGRMVVCTSTIKDDLPAGVKWPVCMQVFAKLADLEPMVREIGFEAVEIDMSDSLMAQEVDVEQEEEEEEERGEEKDRLSTIEERLEKMGEAEDGKDARGRKRVHGGGGEDFKHLGNFDMNELCARVVVIGKKPEKGGGGAIPDDVKEAMARGGCLYV